MEIEDVAKVFNFLPIHYKRLSDKEYIDFLWCSFVSNYEGKQYQFSFIAFHMIYMSFIYFVIWRIREFKGNDFEKIVIGMSVNRRYENDLGQITSPFTFADIGESDIFKFFKLFDCQHEKILDWHKSVTLRNSTTHSNGTIRIGEDNFEKEINHILKCVSEIQTYSQKLLLETFENFLLGSFYEEDLPFGSYEDEIRENFVSKYDLSIADIRFLRKKFNVYKLKENENFPEIKLLFEKFKAQTFTL